MESPWPKPGVQEELPWGDLSHLDWEHRYFQAGLALRDFSEANQEKRKEVSDLKWAVRPTGFSRYHWSGCHRIDTK